MPKAIPDDADVARGRVTKSEVFKLTHEEALNLAIEAVTAYTAEQFSGLDEQTQQDLQLEFGMQVLAHRYVSLDNTETTTRAVLDASFICGDSLPSGEMVFVLVHAGPEFLEAYVAEHDDLVLWRGETDGDEGYYYCSRQSFRDGYDQWKKMRQHVAASPLAALLHGMTGGKVIVLEPGQCVELGGDTPHQSGQSPSPRRRPTSPGSERTH